MRQFIVVWLFMAMVSSILLPLNLMAEGKQQNKEKVSLSTEEVRELVKDHKDKFINENKLLEMGDSLFPAFIEILHNPDNAIEFSRILSLIGKMNAADKAVFFPHLRHLLQNENIDRIAVLGTLGKIGSAEDCQYILPCLRDSNKFVRINAAYTLAKFGDEKTSKEIEDILDKRLERLKNEDIKKDNSFADGYIAILTIKYKTIKAKLEKEQDAKTKKTLIKEWQDLENKYNLILLEQASPTWMVTIFTTTNNEIAKAITARLLKRVLHEDTKLDINLGTDQKKKETMERLQKEVSEYDDEIKISLEEKEKDKDDKPDKKDK